MDNEKDWISVKDRVPAKHVPVLVFSGGNCYVAERYTWRIGSIGFERWSMPQYVADPSHWIPLPAPPVYEE